MTCNFFYHPFFEFKRVEYWNSIYWNDYFSEIQSYFLTIIMYTILPLLIALRRVRHFMLKNNLCYILCKIKFFHLH